MCIRDRLGDGLPGKVVLGLPAATIDEACSADTVLVIGPDLKEELPILHLRLRGAAKKKKVKVVEITPVQTGVSSYAHRSIICRSGEAAKTLKSLLASDDELSEEIRSGSVVVILGRSSLAESALPAIEAASVITEELPEAKFLVALRRGNVRGAIDMGLSPGLLPGRVPLENPNEEIKKIWAKHKIIRPTDE